MRVEELTEEQRKVLCDGAGVNFTGSTRHDMVCQSLVRLGLMRRNDDYFGKKLVHTPAGIAIREELMKEEEK